VPDNDAPITVGAVAGWVEWTLKISPMMVTAALFLFTLYDNQKAMMKHDEKVDARLVTLETEANARDKAMIERLAKLDASISELNHDLQFYQQVKTGGK
jgi:hypothetical protein